MFAGYDTTIRILSLGMDLNTTIFLIKDHFVNYF